MDRDEFLAAARRRFDRGERLDAITIARLVEANDSCLCALTGRPSLPQMPRVRLGVRA